jgi:hypothetical protein
VDLAKISKVGPGARRHRLRQYPSRHVHLDGLLTLDQRRRSQIDIQQSLLLRADEVIE